MVTLNYIAVGNSKTRKISDAFLKPQFLRQMTVINTELSDLWNIFLVLTRLFICLVFMKSFIF